LFFQTEISPIKSKASEKHGTMHVERPALASVIRINKKYVEKWKDKLPAGPTVHDFRRSACRNTIRSSVPQQVAKMVSGHKTDPVFNRYNIVSEKDLKLAAQKQESYLQAQKGTISGTIHQLATKKKSPTMDNPLKLLVLPAGFEPATYGFEVL
jgi:hypothetical protein